PVGAVKEVSSNFQLICGTNRNLSDEVEKGRFREDLLARINLWTFFLPGLRDRHEDIEPNVDFELESFEESMGTHVSFNKEAQEKFLDFATSPEASWHANFRDLSGAITRMATLALGGKINIKLVEEEIDRLLKSWRKALPARDETTKVLSEIFTDDELFEIDPFDRPQLAYVITVCRGSRSLSEAGRKLYSVSRAKKKTPNDADRLSKYFSRFNIDWQQIKNISITRS
ncbi:MAG: sigma 54-interacting transcriptional regulator, partial [Thermodesulfobacteriota bacterium]